MIKTITSQFYIMKVKQHDFQIKIKSTNGRTNLTCNIHSSLLDNGAYKQERVTKKSHRKMFTSNFFLHIVFARKRDRQRTRELVVQRYEPIFFFELSFENLRIQYQHCSHNSTTLSWNGNKPIILNDFPFSLFFSLYPSVALR